MKWSYRLSLLRSATADLLWPRCCAACRGALGSGDVDWCGPCAAGVLEAGRLDYCPSCGKTASQYVVRDNRCPQCDRPVLGCDRFVRAAKYEGPVREAILAYKYGRRQLLDRLFARMLHASILGAGLSGRIDCFVPVPLHWKRLLWRRFNQAALLARILASRENAIALPALKRVEDRPPQVTVPASKRPKNVQGVFAPTRAARKLAGRSVCLIDDVRTTGSTIREAVRVLKKTQARSVYVAVIAVAESDYLADVDLGTL